MFRLGIIYKNGEITGETFNTKAEAENYILEQTKEIKRADVKNLDTGEREQLY